MPSNIILGKVKLVYKDDYNVSTEYSSGDIVTFVSSNNVSTKKLFIYKNSTPKIGSSPILNNVTGNVASLSSKTNNVTITLPTNPGGHFNHFIVPNKSYFYSVNFPSDTIITGFTSITSFDVQLTLSKYSTNTSTIINDQATIGSRRIGNRYDRQINNIDWDVYSESSLFRGSFSSTNNYDVGDIVVENNQSYICISPVGYSTGNVGPSSISKIPNPEFDFLGVWDNYTDNGVGKNNKIITFANRNPFYWLGHPFISSPTTGGTTSSGIRSEYRGGIPWTSPDAIRNNDNAWRWNGNSGLKGDHSIQIGSINGEGRQLIIGGLGEFAVTGGGSGNAYGFPTEGDSYSNNSYWTNDSPAPGNQLWNNNFNIKPKNKPHAIQYLHNRQNRLYLLSNGTVAIAGKLSAIGGFGSNEDISGNAALEIPRLSFQNRSIVKLACSNNSPQLVDYSHGMALDEYGELWMWGTNSAGQLGFGNELINPKETSENVLSLGIGHEQSPIGGDNTKHFSPYKLPSKSAFGNSRIVDMCCGQYASYALDEYGNLWSWGYNNYGQLGYPTQSGFNSPDRSIAPRKITSPLGYTWAYNSNNGLEGTVTTTNISTITAGKSFTKTTGGAVWNSEVRSSTAYSSSVAISAKAGQTNKGIMFGLNSDPTTDANFVSIDFAWYIQSNGTANIYENSVAIALSGTGTVTYTTSSVFSIVYDANEGFVNYYFDLDGDGKFVHLMRRILKTGVGGNSQSADLFFDSSFFEVDGNLNSISVSSGTANITLKNWNHYGGIQKFSAATCNTSYNYDFFVVLDGTGNIWNAGHNAYGQLGSGTVISDDNTGSLKRRKFGSTGIADNINNFWVMPNNIFFSVSTIPVGHSNLWAVGQNNNYQLTTNNVTDQSTPVQIKGSTLRTDNSISTNNFLKDIVSMSTGGGTSVAGNNMTFYALDLYGYVHSAGYDYDGVSGAIADTTNNSDITQNVSKMQHLTSDANSSWVRCYMPNTQHGKVIDIYLTGEESSGSAFAHGAFLTKDGSLLSCGSSLNFDMFTNQGVSIRVPQYNYNLGG